MLHAAFSSIDMLAWFPENISTYGKELDDLFKIIYWLCVAIFFLTFGLMGLFMIIYRKREGHKAYNYHGNNVVEITWTILPTMLFFGLGLYSDDMWQTTKYSARVPKADVEILCLGKQFGWYFLYPGADGKFGRNAYNDESARELMSLTNPFGRDTTDPNGADDFVTENQFTVPMNADIVVRGSAIDVIHSFFLPHARVKQDVIPGTWMNIWFNLTKTGKYELACAELCGSGHYSMRAVYTILSPADYDKWLDQKNQESLAIRGLLPTAPAAEATSDSTATAEETSETENGEQ
ncbi:MAG: cytochrome c oxidase subunit II [Bradyrhizobiaceae bacterium]|nr:cytochrome c oxidase subunit II [Bradyrhizobiaceae bacterium]